MWLTPTGVAFDRRRAMLMLQGALRILHREGGGRLWAYPDIALRPIPSAEEMKKAINYVFKSWGFGKCYLDALARGCPLVGLNMEFQSTYFGSEHILYPFPDSSGLSRRGAKLGNMSERAGKDYIGDPLPRILNGQQVKRFLERMARDECWAWEVVRYSKHLALKAKLNAKRAKKRLEQMDANLLQAERPA